jgi:hypothetical protein
MGLKKTPVSKPVASTTTKNPMQIAKEKMNAKRKARGASTSNIMGGKPINGFTRTQRNMVPRPSFKAAGGAVRAGRGMSKPKPRLSFKGAAQSQKAVGRMRGRGGVSKRRRR